MKKLLSLLLTLCLLIAVTVIPVPAMAATGEIMFDLGEYGISSSAVPHNIGETIVYPKLPSHPNGTLVWSLYSDVYEEPPTVLEDAYLQVYAILIDCCYTFEGYNPNRWIAMSGRVAPTVDPDNPDNTVIQFNNNGIPYRNNNIDSGNTYTKSGSAYTKVTSPNKDDYANYYHASATQNIFKAGSTTYNDMEAYNAIELGALKASTSYRVTINYKRKSLANALYIQPVTWSKEANQRGTMTPYNNARITIPATSTPDSDFVTVTTEFTTPAAFVTSGEFVGDMLRLILFTGKVDANNVVYFDNIAVDEIVPAELTCNYADGSKKVVEIIPGKAIPAPAPNKFGENYGKWYTDKQGTTEAPAIMPEDELTVYEILEEGYFDFENHYLPGDNNTAGSAVRTTLDTFEGKGVMKFDNIEDNSKRPSSGTITNTGNYKGVSGTDRYNSIGIGEVAAGVSKTYKVTVAVKQTAKSLPLKLAVFTNSYYLSYTKTRTLYDTITLPAVDTDDAEYKEVVFTFTTPANLVNDNTTVDDATLLGNELFLLPFTGKAGNCVAYIDYIKVEEEGAAAQTYTVTFNRGGVEQKVEDVAEGTEITLPDTEFTDSSWWNNSSVSSLANFVGYEGDKVTVDGNITLYTAETYSNGQNDVYKNWTGIDTTTESFSFLYKTDTTGSAWEYNGSSAVCTRLGVVEDNVTYRISVTYKATTQNDINFYFLTTSLANSGGKIRSFLEDGKAFHTVSEDTNGFVTATFYITADLPAELTASSNGLDDIKTSGENCGLYLALGKAAGNAEIAIKKTTVEKIGEVIGTTGASVLTDAAAQQKGSQAIRYYFNYKTQNEGADIVIDSESYEIVERGIIITKGAIGKYGSFNSSDSKYYYYTLGDSQYGYVADHFNINLGEANAVSNSGIFTVKSVSGEDLKKMWSLDGDTVTFSNYLVNIPEAAYNNKFLVKGFVTFKDADGNEHTIYSKTVNRSVNGIANVLNQRH